MKKKQITVIFLLFLTLQTASNATLAIEFISNDKKDTTAIKQEKLPVLDAFSPQEQPESIPVQGSVSANAMISIDDCIKMAIENNPNILSSIANKEIYKTKIGQAWSAYFPEFDISTGYTRTKMMMPALKGIKMAPYNHFKTITSSASMLLYDFGKTGASVRMAKKTFEASEKSLQGTINEVIYNVKDAYYQLMFAIQQEEVWAETVDRYQITYNQAKAYYEIGTKPKLDVTTAKYNLDNAKLSHIKAKNNIDLMYAQLNNAMGLPEYTNYNISSKIKNDRYFYELKNLLSTASETRPELLAAKKKSEASEQLIKATKCAFLPDLKISADYSLGGTDPGADYGYGFGGALQYQTTNLMYLKKQVDEAKATAKKDKADYETTRQNVYLQVKQAYISMFEAQESLPVAKSAMLTAKEQYELASGRYKVGIGDVVELKDSENTFLNAQLDYYKSLLDYNISAANLERVVGAPLETVEQHNLKQQEQPSDEEKKIPEKANASKV